MLIKLDAWNIIQPFRCRLYALYPSFNFSKTFRENVKLYIYIFFFYMSIYYMPAKYDPYRIWPRACQKQNVSNICLITLTTFYLVTWKERLMGIFTLLPALFYSSYFLLFSMSFNPPPFVSHIKLKAVWTAPGLSSDLQTTASFIHFSLTEWF